jgi:3-mercaptopyruvate sulfurtransferase SseA
VALQFKRLGLTNVHPLEGGIEAWTALGYPVVAMAVPKIPAAGTGATEARPSAA